MKPQTSHKPVIHLSLSPDAARLIQHAIEAQKARARKDIKRGFVPDPERLNMKHKSLGLGQTIIDDINAQYPRKQIILS